jgi:hypothetical protein
MDILLSQGLIYKMVKILRWRKIMVDIVKIIKADMESKRGKYEARAYYNNEVGEATPRYLDIIDSAGNIKTIDTGNKEKLYTNYFRLLVDQKAEYLLAKPVTSKTIDPYELTELFTDGVYNASLDGQTWLFLYLKDNQIQVEIWTSTSLTKMIIEKDKVIATTEHGHYMEQELYQGQVTAEYNRFFNQVPFVPLYNNRNKESDLDNIQALLDVYNSISTGFVSNINDFQEALIKLQGFSGDSEVLKETMANMKTYKMVGIPTDGDMEYMKVEIPVEPRRVILELVKE